MQVISYIVQIHMQVILYIVLAHIQIILYNVLIHIYIILHIVLIIHIIIISIIIILKLFFNLLFLQIFQRRFGVFISRPIIMLTHKHQTLIVLSNVLTQATFLYTFLHAFLHTYVQPLATYLFTLLPLFLYTKDYIYIYIQSLFIVNYTLNVSPIPKFMLIMSHWANV